MNIPPKLIDSADFVFCLDPDNEQVLWSNRSALGHFPKVIDSGLSSLIDQEELIRIKSIFRNEGVFQGKIQVTRAKSSELHEARMFWTGGEASAILLQIKENEVKSNDEKISREYFESLADNTPDIVIFHQHGLIKYANSAACEFFAFEDYKDTSLASLLPNSSRKWFEKRFDGSEKTLTAAGEVELIDGRNRQVTVYMRSTILPKDDMIMEIISTSPDRMQLIAQSTRSELENELKKLLHIEEEQHSRNVKHLLKARDLSRDVLTHSMDAIFMLDGKGRIVQFNSKAEEQYGLIADKVKGETPEILFKPKKQWKEIKRISSEEGKYSGEAQSIHSSGRVFTTLLHLITTHDRKGNVTGYLCISRDISQLQEAEQKLLKSEARYKDLFENANDYIFSFEENGKLLFSNNSFKKAIGYSISTLSRKTIFDLIDDDWRAGFEAELKEILKGEKSTGKIETVLRGARNAIIYVELNVNSVFNKGKLYQIRCIGRDTTEARKAEKLAKEHAARLEAIFNSGDLLLWTVNRNIGLTSFNQKYAETIYHMYGIWPEKHADIGKKRKLFASNEYHNEWKKRYEKCFDGKSLKFQTKTLDRYGNTHFRDIFLNPVIEDGQDEIEEVAGIALDITDKKVTEQKLKEQVAHINSIFDSSSHIIWSLNNRFELTSFNRNFEKSHKSIHGKSPILGMKIDLDADYAHDPNREKWHKAYMSVLKGNRLHFEIKNHIPGKGDSWSETYLNPIYDENQNVIGISAISHDINFKKKAEQKIKDQAAKINSIFDSTAMLIFTLDGQKRITSFNKKFSISLEKRFQKEINLGDTLHKALGHYVSEGDLEEFDKAINKALKGNSLNLQSRVELTEGTVVWLESYLNPIFQDNGEVYEISCLTHEITEKKLAEEHIRESLREKEILLQEVHHRVKNNLQVISSILNLQSTYVKDRNTLDILKESQNRIKTMSFIHESLYQNKDFSSIDLSEYLLTLSHNLLHSYSLKAGAVKLNTNLGNVSLNLDQAIPCGLIVNELISNSLKYAFPDGKSGVISLKCEEKEDIVRLEISDDGIGLPKDFDIKYSESLGLQLVITLVDQLDADLRYNSTKKGTKYLINFAKQARHPKNLTLNG